MSKILMATHYFDSHQGGIELVARKMFDGLAHRECQMVWAAAKVSEAAPTGCNQKVLPLETWEGLEKFLGVPLPIPTPSAYRQLRQATQDADLLLLHDCLYVGNIAAFLMARARGIPVVIVQHIGLVPYENRILRSLMRMANACVTRPMLAAADQVVFISDITKRTFASVRFRKPPTVVHNGVDSIIFHPVAPSEKRTLRAKLCLPRDGVVALFVGRFVEKKGLHVFREMAQRAPEITWLFAGDGPLDPRAWKLENVRVYRQRSGRGIAELYGASDVFILPSVGEGFPLVLQEALASGLPVVCNHDTAQADSELSATVTGVALSPGNARESAEKFLGAIHQLMSEPQPGDAMQARHEFTRARYSWSRSISAYFDLIRGLVQDQKQTSSSELPLEAMASDAGKGH